MNVPELIQLVEPNAIHELLAAMKANNITPYKWRIAPTGSTKLGRIFVLRAETHRGEAILGGFPTIPYLIDQGWLACHVLTGVVSEKVKSFSVLSLTKPP